MTALHDQVASEYHTWFDSIEELRVETAALMSSENADQYQHDAINRHTREWCHAWFGCESADIAMRFMENGWRELFEKLQPMIEHLRKTFELDAVTPALVEVRKRKRHRSDHGDTVDMHRVWGGQLDTAWERPVKTVRMSATQRYASVYADLAISCNVPFLNTLWRAAAALCIVDVLTRAAINVEVWAGVSAHTSYSGVDSPRKNWHAVRVKDYTQPINEDRFACLFSAACFRTYGWAMLAGAPWNLRQNWGVPLNRGLPHNLREREARGERVFRMGECLSEQGAEQEIRTVMETLKQERQECA